MRGVSRRGRLVLAAGIGAVTALILSMTMGAFATGTSSTVNMAANSQMGVGCPNALSVSQPDVSDANLTCAADATTTTQATTTTTVQATSTTTTSPPTTNGAGGGSSPCPQFLTEPAATQAFCDPLTGNEATGQASRTGALNNVLWGVDRWTGNDNPNNPDLAYNWADSTQQQCGTSAQVSNLDDVTSCGGSLVESSNDNGFVTNLAMYPRQPFDFAGRTGVVEFNVSDNSEQSHAAWPSFVISDQPVPAPYSDPDIAEVNARNSIGVDLVGNGTSSPHCVTGIIWETTNYQASNPAENGSGCALAASGPGQMNHVEVQVSATGMAVYVSDAGTSHMVLVAQASFAVPLTRGLVWLDDVHYNGDKFGTQQTDTFAWNNLAFDGPVLPRDLGFDVLDNTIGGPRSESGQPTTYIGWHINPTCCWKTETSANLVTATGPTADQIAAASGALIVLNVDSGTKDLVYTVNGHFNSIVPPGSGAIALPVMPSELVPGPNTITVSFGDGANGDIANVDLILQGAGGVVQPS